MSSGVFNTGRKWLSDKALKNLYSGSTLSLGLYNNAIGSLTHRNVLADIVPITGTGYAALSIAANDWTVSIVQAADPLDDAVWWTIADTYFTASAANWSAVRGAYLFDASNNIALAWRDAPIEVLMPQGMKTLVDFLSEISAG